MKIKIKLLVLAMAVSSLAGVSIVPRALADVPAGDGGSSTTPTSTPSQQVIQACYIYNGHGSGPDTDNKLNGDLAAAYKTSGCDKTQGGPCTSNPVTQGIRVTCTAPTGNGTGADGTGGTTVDCSKYGLTTSASNDACIYNPNSAAAADPALKGCGSSSDGADTQDCDIIHKYVNPLIQVLSALVGITVAAAIAYGGILYSTSSGDAGKVGKAKDLIRNAVLAMIIYIFFYSFIQWLVPGGIFHK